MPIQFTCPFCGVQTNVADQYAGQTGPCSKCGREVTVPGSPVEPGAYAAAPPPRKSSSTAVVIVVVVLGVLGMMVVCGGVLVALMLPAIQSAREAARRVQCANSVRQISLALHSYHDAHGQFPPAYLADENGNPMHSWRVLILPQLGQQHAYDQYNFDEPWDSPANRAALSQVWTSPYECPSTSNPGGGKTNYVMVVGPGCFSEGPTGRKLDEFTDGTSNTIMIVEIADSNIDWAEPRDLDAATMSYEIDDTSGQPCISSNHPGVANVGLADGSVHCLSSDADPDVVRKMTRINDGGPQAYEIP